jgi:PAS domain-containing protein
MWLLAASLGAIMAFKLAVVGRDGGTGHDLDLRDLHLRHAGADGGRHLAGTSAFPSRAAIAEAAQEQLRASEHELRKLSLAVEQCPASIVITDMQTHVVYANQAFLQRSGYALQEVLGARRSVHHGHG